MLFVFIKLWFLEWLCSFDLSLFSLSPSSLRSFGSVFFISFVDFLGFSWTFEFEGLARLGLEGLDIVGDVENPWYCSYLISFHVTFHVTTKMCVLLNETVWSDSRSHSHQINLAVCPNNQSKTVSQWWQHITSPVTEEILPRVWAN